MTHPQRLLYIHSDGKARRRLPLPLRTRIRLRVVRWINTTCCWLCGADLARLRDAAMTGADAFVFTAPRRNCRVYWGSHGCIHPRGHPADVPHACDCCKCDRHPDPDPDNLDGAPSCVAAPPYYGDGTLFYGEDAEALGLPPVKDRGR